jgi:hypothetical protein
MFHDDFVDYARLIPVHDDYIDYTHVGPLVFEMFPDSVWDSDLFLTTLHITPGDTHVN